MSILPVYLYNHPVLKKKTEPIAEMTGELRTFIQDMFDTMYAADGIGLAANQVGASISVTVIDVSRADYDDEDYDDDNEHIEPIALINPIIEYFSDEEIDFEEGCLSLPHFREKVMRPDAVQIRYMDIDMKEHTIEADGLFARVAQHEIDHLNGIYFFERLSSLRRTLSQKKLKRIIRGEITPKYSVVDAFGKRFDYSPEDDE